MPLSPLETFDGWVRLAVVPAGGIPPEMSVPLADVPGLELPAEAAAWVREHAATGVQIWAAVDADSGDEGDATVTRAWQMGREACLGVHAALVRAAARWRQL